MAIDSNDDAEKQLEELRSEVDELENMHNNELDSLNAKLSGAQQQILDLQSEVSDANALASIKEETAHAYLDRLNAALSDVSRLQTVVDELSRSGPKLVTVKGRSR
jgi:chromosome segregation ATPase